jgi:hypothetical protein
LERRAAAGAPSIEAEERSGSGKLRSDHALLVECSSRDLAGAIFEWPTIRP